MSLANRLLSRFSWLKRSSTLRLSLLLSAIFALAMTAAIFFAIELGRDAVMRRVDATLETLANNSVLQDANSDNFSVIIRAPNAISDLPRPFRNAVQRGGGTISLNNDFRNADVWRVLVTQDSNAQPILIAVPIEDSEDALELLSGILWGTVGFIIAVTLIIGVGAGLLARRRIRRIDETLSRLARGELTARTGTSASRDDLDDVANQLDQTASELEKLVAQTRNLSASIAHDLRTPLARLRAQLEQLPDSTERSTALEEATHLSEVFDTIMRIARIEVAQGDDGFENVELDTFMTDMADIFGPVIEDAGKTMNLEISSAVTVSADRQMLIQAVANLIQNALAYGGQTITLRAQQNSLGVSDNGAGVDPAMHDEIVKPMVRLDKTRASEGSGLGLALVRAVADRHGATLELSQNQPSGLSVMLNFAKL